VIHYLALSTPYALALASGQVDTIPLWAAPPEGVLGSRVALWGSGWSMTIAAGLQEREGVKFSVRDPLRTGRVGSVLIMGYVETAHPWDRKGIAGQNWTSRPVPKRIGAFHWLVAQPKIELGQSVLGLSRLPVSYADRPSYQTAIREYGDRYGAERLPAEDRELYVGLVRKAKDANSSGK
jgi:hypothetical protein